MDFKFNQCFYKLPKGLNGDLLCISPDRGPKYISTEEYLKNTNFESFTNTDLQKIKNIIEIELLKRERDEF